MTDFVMLLLALGFFGLSSGFIALADHLLKGSRL